MLSKQIRYLVSVLGRRFEARTVRGREALSAPNCFIVTVNVPIEDDLDPDDVAGQIVGLEIENQGTIVRRLELVALRVERLAAAQAPDVVQTIVELELISRWALLEYRVDSRVFRDMDVPTIVEQVCAGLGIGVEKRLATNYRVRPYTVQYRESDLNFICRLLEDEGIYHTDLGQSHLLMLGDSPAAYDSGGANLSFVPTAGFHTETSAVTDVGWTGRATASRVTMRDFDFERPKVDVIGTAQVPAQASASGGEWYEYPAGRRTPGEAQEKADKVAAAFAAEQHRLAGRATELGLAPNGIVNMSGLPTGLVDGEFVMVHVDHDWEIYGTTFSTSFEALEANRVFRPVPRTPKPSLAGGMIGKVTGPPGADIHCDEWGRTKVHFPWDRLQPQDDTCSDWIPTLQDNTGSSIGIPRVGWEVLVQHLEGDVDRPVILGRTYNPVDTFYAKLPQNRMWTTLRSRTSPRSADGPTGENFIQMQDLAGVEHIHTHAQRDLEFQTERDKTETTLSTDGRIVDGNERIRVGRTRKVTVAESDASNVGENQTVAIGRHRQVRVKGAYAESTGRDRKQKIGSQHMRRFDTMDEMRVQGNASETIGAIDLEMCPKNNQSTTSHSEARVVGGAMIEMAKRSIGQTVAKNRVEVVGGLSYEQAKERIGQRTSKTRTTMVGGNYVADAGTDTLFSGLVSFTMQVGEMILSAKEKLTLKVQETTLILEGERSVVEAPSFIAARASGKNDLSAGKSGQNDRKGSK